MEVDHPKKVTTELHSGVSIVAIQYYYYMNKIKLIFQEAMNSTISINMAIQMVVVAITKL